MSRSNQSQKRWKKPPGHLCFYTFLPRWKLHIPQPFQQTHLLCSTQPWMAEPHSAHTASFTPVQEHLIQLFNFQHHPIVLNGLHQRESHRNRKVRTEPYGQGFLQILKLMMHSKLSQINNNGVSLKQKHFQHLKFTRPICPFRSYNCTYKRGTYPHTAQITPSIGCLIHEVLEIQLHSQKSSTDICY